MINQKTGGYKRKRRKKIFVGTGIFIISVFLALQIVNFMADVNVRYVPDYEKADLKPIIEMLDEEAYKTMLSQTGLGKDAVDKILSSDRYALQTFEAYQSNFFNGKRYDCEKIGIVTKEERLYKESGGFLNGYVLADIRDGDILITKATHSVGWRHGHAGIVLDAQKGMVLEAVIWGKPSMIQRLSKWRTYPTFIQLRAKDSDAAAKAASYAAENMDGVDYGLLTGLLPDDGEKASSTQCAHLPWYVYRSCGIDIDSDGGWLVTPKDIANSEELEIVQIYGVNPDDVWK